MTCADSADSAPYRVGRPIGIDREAYSSSPMLIATDTRKAIVHGTFLKPSTKRSDVG